MWLRRLPTDRIERQQPDLAEVPLVVTATVKSARQITALNDEAAQLGLHAGMSLADARAMYPALKAIDADEAADARLLDAIADWCDRYTPLVGLDPTDGLLLDISGCAHLFGGEDGLRRDLTQRLTAQGFHVNAVIADTPGCAFAVARYGSFGIVRPGAMRLALAPLPLAALRIDAKTRAALAQTGLKRIADILDLPRAPLAARFGQNFVRRLDQALGIEDESIMPRLPVPSFLAERRFAEPIGREDDVLGTIVHLAQELARAMERHGKGARRLEAALFRTDGTVVRVDVGTSEPLRDPQRIRRLFLDRLAVLGDATDPGFGFDMVRLSAIALETRDAVQTGLHDGDPQHEIAHLIDRLMARFGAQRVQRLIPQDTHIPELAARPVAAISVSAPAKQLLPDPEEHLFQDSLIPTRPLRLFERPEPIETLAEVPDGPPLQFRWRRIWHQVAHAEGPERIAMEWWRDENGRALTRDYFRVESRQGARVWLYREDIYAEGHQPKWFLHGIFA